MWVPEEGARRPLLGLGPGDGVPVREVELWEHDGDADEMVSNCPS